jgi:hypothetical protein
MLQADAEAAAPPAVTRDDARGMSFGATSGDASGGVVGKAPASPLPEQSKEDEKEPGGSRDDSAEAEGNSNAQAKQVVSDTGVGGDHRDAASTEDVELRVVETAEAADVTRDAAGTSNEAAVVRVETNGATTDAPVATAGVAAVPEEVEPQQEDVDEPASIPGRGVGADGTDVKEAGVEGAGTGRCAQVGSVDYSTDMALLIQLDDAGYVGGYANGFSSQNRDRHQRLLAPVGFPAH